MTTWDNARSVCLDLGGDLVSIGDVDVNNYVKSKLTGNIVDLWAGGNDKVTEGTWVWSDGVTWSYTDWHTGGGNDDDEDCLVVTANPSWWVDVPCTTEHYFMCEKDPGGKGFLHGILVL